MKKNNQRVAIVTGASSGIGKATVERFVSDGVIVIANSRRKDKLTELEKKYNNGQQMIHAIAGDITNDTVIEKLFHCSDSILEIPPSIFVLSAGHGLPGTILSSDPSKWAQLFEINCLSAFKQLRFAASKMQSYAEKCKHQSAYDIVVIGSTIGRTISSFNPVYGATKFALHSLVESLRQEVCGNYIRVTLIEPGFVHSEFQQTAGYDLEWFKEIVANIGPILDPEDIANTISFVINQPKHIHLDDIRLRPTRQKI